MLNDGWDLVDVRSSQEFAAVHARGALNLPLDQLNVELVKSRCPSRKVLLICQGGVRSKSACIRLGSNSDLETVSVLGGTNAWHAAGLPTEKGV